MTEMRSDLRFFCSTFRINAQRFPASRGLAAACLSRKPCAADSICERVVVGA
jgi:hypothetical protein